MKRLIPVAVIAVAAALFWFRGHILPPPPGQMNYLGYAEGETVLIAPPQAGRIMTRPVAKGQAVARGDTVFTLDDTAAKLEVERAGKAVVTAAATYQNLLTGKRPAELAQIEAQSQETEAGLDLARKELQRASALTSTGTAAQARLDAATSQVAAYEARLHQFEFALAAARLPARQDEIAAAAARIEEAKAAVAVAQQKLQDLTLTSPIDGTIDDTFFEAGEWVAAGQPVLAILSPSAVTLRFYVPEAAVALATPGRQVSFTCDGCGAARTATITHTAATPEYTPPVIYSQGARAKLVFLVEAQPDGASRLAPGLPVEVMPLQ